MFDISVPVELTIRPGGASVCFAIPFGGPAFRGARFESLRIARASMQALLVECGGNRAEGLKAETASLFTVVPDHRASRNDFVLEAMEYMFSYFVLI